MFLLPLQGGYVVINCKCSFIILHINIANGIGFLRMPCLIVWLALRKWCSVQKQVADGRVLVRLLWRTVERMISGIIVTYVVLVDFIFLKVCVG